MAGHNQKAIKISWLNFIPIFTVKFPDVWVVNLRSLVAGWQHDGEKYGFALRLKALDEKGLAE